jgi:hypothetical protein
MPFLQILRPSGAGRWPCRGSTVTLRRSLGCLVAAVPTDGAPLRGGAVALPRFYGSLRRSLLVVISAVQQMARPSGAGRWPCRYSRGTLLRSFGCVIAVVPTDGAPLRGGAVALPRFQGYTPPELWVCDRRRSYRYCAPPGRGGGLADIPGVRSSGA